MSGGVKKSFFKFASGLLNSRSFIFKRKRVKPPHKRSKLRLLIDIYKDYKALGKNIPLSRAGLFKIKRKKGINFYNSGMTARDESTVPLSRRQRLMGLARNTRDNYIPKITGSVSSFASGASRLSPIPMCMMRMDEYYCPRIPQFNYSPRILDTRMGNILLMFKAGFSLPGS